jgi:methylated-DNA-[protein]-cysteine S-methyltransferase
MGGDSVIYTTMDSPLGELLLLGDGDVLHGLHMQAGRHPIQIQPRWARDDEAFADIRTQLEEYFAGERDSFDIKMHMDGTAFQRTVWHELTRSQ